MRPLQARARSGRGKGRGRGARVAIRPRPFSGSGLTSLIAGHGKSFQLSGLPKLSSANGFHRTWSSGFGPSFRFLGPHGLPHQVRLRRSSWNWARNHRSRLGHRSTSQFERHNRSGWPTSRWETVLVEKSKKCDADRRPSGGRGWRDHWSSREQRRIIKTRDHCFDNNAKGYASEYRHPADRYNGADYIDNRHNGPDYIDNRHHSPDYIDNRHDGSNHDYRHTAQSSGIRRLASLVALSRARTEPSANPPLRTF